MPITLSFVSSGGAIVHDISATEDSMWISAIENTGQRGNASGFLAEGIQLVNAFPENKPKLLYTRLKELLADGRFLTSCRFISVELSKIKMNVCHVGDFRLYASCHGDLYHTTEHTVANSTREELRDYGFEFQEYHKNILLKGLNAEQSGCFEASWVLGLPYVFYIISNGFHNGQGYLDYWATLSSGDIVDLKTFDIDYFVLKGVVS